MGSQSNEATGFTPPPRSPDPVQEEARVAELLWERRGDLTIAEQETARRILARCSRGGWVQLTDGFAVVPVEPTDKMVEDAAYNVFVGVACAPWTRREDNEACPVKPITKNNCRNIAKAAWRAAVAANEEGE
jgi:hypothetical protein